jgi:hypothetical protein
VITSSYEDGSCTFLDHPITSWARTNGDPRSDASSSSNTKKFDGKLSGNYSWPFSFPFPKEVAIGIQGEQQTYLTPQTFLERDTRGNVQYELVLRVTHGVLRSDSKYARAQSLGDHPPVLIWFIGCMRMSCMSLISLRPHPLFCARSHMDRIRSYPARMSILLDGTPFFPWS